jgi:hypothetical protein
MYTHYTYNTDLSKISFLIVDFNEKLRAEDALERALLDGQPALNSDPSNRFEVSPLGRANTLPIEPPSDVAFELTGKTTARR